MIKRVLSVFLTLSILVNIGLGIGWFLYSKNPPKPVGFRVPITTSIANANLDLTRYNKKKNPQYLQDASWRLSEASGILWANSDLGHSKYSVNKISQCIEALGVDLMRQNYIPEVAKDLSVFNQYLNNDKNYRKIESNETYFEKQLSLAFNKLPKSKSIGECN